MTRLLRLIAAAAFALLSAAPLLADSWIEPERRVYRSADRQWRLIVTPRVDPRRPVAERACGAPPPRGVLERRGPNRRWVRVWDRPLVNEIAPTDALIADGRHYVVTLDNWYFEGSGENDVVIYDAEGGTVRSLALQDFLPADYIVALPHTFSSRWWREGHRFSEDGTRLILSIVMPAPGRGPFDAGGSVELEIDLATGRPLEPTSEAWRAALAAAGPIAAERRRRWEADEAAFGERMTAPASDNPVLWDRYLWQAFVRLDPDWEQASPRREMLVSPVAADYAASVTRLSTALSEGGDGELQVLMFGSPSPDNLALVLADALRRLAPGALRGVRVYVVAGGASRDRIEAALAPTGATFVHIDPAVPIPRRPEAEQEPRPCD